MSKSSKQLKDKAPSSPVVIKFPRLLALQKKIEQPMLVLSFVWLCVLIAELIYTTNNIITLIGTFLWILFILYFLMRLIIVSARVSFLKKNWLFVIAILVSILRFFPVQLPFPFIRVITATFGMQVIWIFASVDLGMRSIRKKLGHRGVGYALTFTTVVIFVGAAGILHFEQVSDSSERIQTYPRAIWWTAMQMTNIGSAYALKTQGGRAVCLLISIYSAAMFGYLTALFASFFIDREIKIPKSELNNQKQILDLKNEISHLSTQVELLVNLSTPKKVQTSEVVSS